MTADIVQLPARENMTVEEAKAFIVREEWQDILAIGYDAEGVFMIRSSKISRELALWLAHCLIDHIRDT